MKLDWMLVILAAAAVLAALSFWRAQRKPGFDFDAFDLIMEGGRLSAERVVFMAVFAFTTWLMLDQQLKARMTEGYFLAYGGMWVGPMVARVIFKKADMPTGTTTTTEVKQTETRAP